MPIGKIICIGDSLTAGDESNPIGYRSYRGALQLLLQNAGYTVDFVGTQSSTPATGGNDPEHDGYGGARMDSSDSAGNSIEGRIATIRTAVGAVDIIILFIGWNDVYQSTASAATKYSDLLLTIRSGTWATAKIVMVTLSPEPNKTPSQTGSDYPVYSQINAQIALEADANHIVADLAALTGSSTADRNTMVEKLLYDAANYPDETTSANGQRLPSVLGGHYITSFKSIQDYNANWRTTVAERRGVNGSTNALNPDTSVYGHPYYRDTVDAMVPWLWMFAGPGHASVNTVIEARNMYAQALRGSNNSWEFFFEGARPGGDPSNTGIYDGSEQAIAGYRPDGITSFYRMAGGTNIEVWPGDTVPSRGIQTFIGARNRGLMADAVCFVAGVQLRLALLDPNGPNDIPQSRFVVCCGWDAFGYGNWRYDHWGWPLSVMDGGHDRWHTLRSTDWQWAGLVTMDRGSGHYEDPAVPPPHESGYPYAHPYNNYPAYSKSATEIRANPPRLPQYYSGGTTASNGWAINDYWFNPGLGARDIHYSQQGADKAARVIYDRMTSAGLLTSFVGGGPIEYQLLPGIVQVARWWTQFTTKATDPYTADWEPAGVAQAEAPTWQTETLPNAVTSAAYSALAVALGVPTPTYTKVSGPAWLSVNSTTGALSGTADATPASVAVVLRATNSAGVADVSLTLLLREGLSITTSALPVFVVDVPYALQVQTAGAQPIEFSATGLPAGVAMSASGVISGTPTTVSSGSVVVTATNPDNTATRTISWQVAAAASLPDITTSSLPSGTVGTVYLAEIAATGAQPITYGAAGVPAGLALSAGTKNLVPNPHCEGLVAEAAGDVATGTQLLVNPTALESSPWQGNNTSRTAPRNLLENSSAQGAVAGTPGTKPTGWGLGPAYDGLNTAIVGRGEEVVVGSGHSEPMPYLDVRLFGTSATTYAFLSHGVGQEFVFLSAGQVVTGAVGTRVVAGALPAGGGRLLMGVRFYTAGYGAEVNTQYVVIGTSPSYARTAATATAGAGTVFGQVALLIDNFAASTAVDFTLRIYAPQMEAGSTASYPVHTYGLATNFLRNSAATGTGLPTYWGFDNGGTGTTLTVVGRSVMSGRPCVDVRIQGTPIGSSYNALYFEEQTQIVASTGQQWTVSAYVQRIAGSSAGIPNIGVGMNENTAAGAYVTGGNGMSLPPSATETRYTHTSTFSGGATIARTLPYLIWNVTAGVAVDITLRIAAPQMQFGATATDPNITYGTQTTSRYWRIAKTTTGGSASVLQASLPRGRLKARVSLLAGNSSQASVGVYDTVTPGWGNLAALSTGVIVSGPGAVSKGDVGALYHVTGLSSTVPTVFEIDRVDNGNSLYVYPDLSGSVVLGASVQVGECKVVAGLQGTLPTGWFQTGSATGLTRTIAAATIDGRPGISVRYQGTAVAGSLNIVYGNNMPALATTAYQRSVTWRLAAGSWAAVTSQSLVGDESSSVPAYLRSNGAGVAAPSAGAARVSHTFVTGVNTASANNYLSLNIASGAVDFTLEFGSPQFERQVTVNRIRNYAGQGGVAGVIGSGGAEPTHWSIATSVAGISRQVIGSSYEGGISYFEVRFFGTPAANGACAVYPETSTGIAATTGQTFAFSQYQRLVGGSTTGLNSPAVVFDELTAAGAYIRNTLAAVAMPTGAALSTQRVSASATLSGGATVGVVRPYWLIGVTSGVTIDFTIRIGCPQLEPGTVPTVASVLSPPTTFADPRYAYISGTPTAPGFYVLAVTATNSLDTDDAALALTINPSPAVSAAQSGGWGKFIRQ